MKKLLPLLIISLLIANLARADGGGRVAAGIIGGAALGARVPLVNLDQGTSIPSRFVLQLAHQFAPRRIRDRLRQSVIADELPDGQRLHAHRLVLTDEARGQLVKAVKTLVSDLRRRPRDLEASLSAVLRAFLLASEVALRMLDAELRICILFTA